MFRVLFKPTNNDDYVYFESSLKHVMHLIKTNHLNDFHPNEFKLITDHKNNFVVLDLYAGFDMWCLDDDTLSDALSDIDMKKLYLNHKWVPQNPLNLSDAEFTKYCEIVCTYSGEYGHIYLNIEQYDPTSDTWTNTFDD